MCADYVVNKAPKVIYVEEKRKPSIWLTVVRSCNCLYQFPVSVLYTIGH